MQDKNLRELTKDTSINRMAFWIDKPFMGFQIFESSLDDCLHMNISEMIKQATKGANFEGLADYYREFHQVQITSADLQMFLEELYINTQVEVAKRYLKANLEDMLYQALEWFVDEAKLAVDENVILDPAIRVSALASDVDKVLADPFPKQIKARLKNWGKPSRTALTQRHLVERILPAYRYCHSNVLKLRDMSRDQVTEGSLEIYDFVAQLANEKPHLIACHLLLKYEQYSGLKLPYTGDADVDSLYNALKKGMKTEKQLVLLLKERGF